MIVDQYGRQFKNLRISLTTACNFACTYCVADGEKRHASQNELTEAQMLRAIRLIRKVTAIDRLRITGGEPLISKKFDSFLKHLNRNDFTEISITTNGQRLAEKIQLIHEQGIQRINVSLDTLDPQAFRSISRSGDLFSVLTGIEQSLALGISVKINMVPLRTRNVDQIIPLLDYCLERGIELRYIELMRMGHLKDSARFERDFISMQHILSLISRHYTFVRTDAPFDSTAIRFLIPGKGNFGIIANESEPFCSSCTRLRLSATGYLHGCLSSHESYYMGDLLDLPDAEALPRLRHMLSRALVSKQLLFSGGETVMRLIGG